jgi:hypothetical protein
MINRIQSPKQEDGLVTDPQIGVGSLRQKEQIVALANKSYITTTILPLTLHQKLQKRPF